MIFYFGGINAHTMRIRCFALGGGDGFGLRLRIGE